MTIAIPLIDVILTTVIKIIIGIRLIKITINHLETINQAMDLIKTHLAIAADRITVIA